MKQIKKKLGSTAGLKTISVLMAVLLWFYVVNQGELGARQDTITARINYRALPAGLTVTGPQTVQVKLWGVFKEPDTVQAYVDLSGLSEGEYSLPVSVNPVKGAMFTSVKPKKVQVKLKKLGSKAMAVKYEIRQNPPDGYRLVDLEVSPEKCLLRGDQSSIDRVAAVIVPVQLGNTRDISSFKARLIPQDKQGMEITKGVDLIPETVEVYAVVEKKKSTRQLTIKPQVTGKPPEGYRLVQAAADPPTVSVLGEESVVKQLDAVTTDNIDITDRKESFSQTVNIVVPHGITVVPAQVNVQITLEKEPEKPLPPGSDTSN
ncbi:MAG: YbbR-like domain-containing protein [Syntrophomonadaceae bacterium]